MPRLPVKEAGSAPRELREAAQDLGLVARGGRGVERHHADAARVGEAGRGRDLGVRGQEALAGGELLALLREQEVHEGDGGRDVADRWTAEHGTPYPILLDPDLKLVRAFDVWNSAYVAVLAPGGRVEALWPGYSADMLQQLSAQLAGLAGMPEAPIDTADAPDLLYSGCPFLIDAPAE